MQRRILGWDCWQRTAAGARGVSKLPRIAASGSAEAETWWEIITRKEVWSRLRLSAILLAAVLLDPGPMSLFAQNPSPDPAPQLTEGPAFTVIGSSIRTSNAQEMSGTDGKIGPLWNQFMHGGAEAVPGVIEQGTIYAVYTRYESDETGAYDLILGKSVAPAQPVPANMKSIHIPASSYLVFSVAGSSPGAIKTAWSNVYAYFVHHTDHRRAFSTDFEQHSSSATRFFIAVG
ncbi:MAG: GyrI-like domain-containing protein [Terriglobales bacterium]